MTENLFVGLLRALGPQLFSFVGFTLFVIIAVVVISKLIGDAEASGARRTVRRSGLVIWVVVLGLTLWSALATIISLRIPRSDVNATEVYQQMDSNVKGNK